MFLHIQKMENEKKNWHDKSYKYLLLIPLALLVFSIVYMGIFYANNHDFAKKDISLTGGTSITVYDKVNQEDLKNSVGNELENLDTRQIYDLTSREQVGLIIQTTTNSETAINVLENFLGYELTESNSSIEFTGSSLSQSFYKQLLIAILIAFVFMAIVVFIIFRNFVPSTAVIISAVADLLMTLVFVNIFGMKLSSAGIVALLMLIGYSVDTDILLTTRVLKRHEGNLNERIFGAFKTGITMTLTSLLAMVLALIIVSSFSEILTQIFSILVIGLCFDLINTWITNVSILKWYVLKKK